MYWSLSHYLGKIPETHNLKKESLSASQFLVGSVHGRLVPRKKQHGGKAQLRRGAQHRVNKHRERKEDLGIRLFPSWSHAFPSDPPGTRTHLLTAHSAMNSPMDQPTDDYSTPMICSPSTCPISE